MIKGISYRSLEGGLDGEHSIGSAIKQAKSAGFEALELAISTEGALTTKTSSKTCAQIRTNINDAGLIVDSVASGMSWSVNPTSHDAGVRQRAIDLHKDALRVASYLECKALLFVPGVVKSPIASDIVRYDEALKRAGEAVEQLLPVAEECGVDLCLENVWNGLFYSPLEFRDFIDSFDSDRLGIYLDVGNLMGYQQYPPHWIELLDYRIKRVHIKDYRENFNWTGGYTFCDLGAGEVPWKETVNALEKIAYKDTIIAEMLPWDPTLLKRTSSAMDQLFGFNAGN
jgi:hexulose-6-phosphate isomerase